MGHTWKGATEDAAGARVGVAVSRFNASLTKQLLERTQAVLHRHGIAEIDVAWCPGAFELPFVADRMARSGNYDAIVALGVVIRGETYHFEVISNAAVNGLEAVARSTQVPVALGVLTANTAAQARKRASGAKAEEAARAALEMIALARQL